MFDNIIRFYHNAKWLHRIFNFVGLILGTYLIIAAFTFLKKGTGGSFSIIIILAGIFFIISSVLDILSKTFFAKIASTLLAISGFVLYLIALSH